MRVFTLQVVWRVLFIAFMLALFVIMVRAAEQPAPTRDELLIQKGANMQMRESVVSEANKQIETINARIKTIDDQLATMAGPTAKNEPVKSKTDVQAKVK